jgi:hypothetical protein
VIEKADQAGGRQEPSEQRFAHGQGQRPQVEVLDRQQIERKERDRVHHRGPADVDPAGELCPQLEPLETGPSRVVQGDDLSIEDEAAYGKRCYGADDLGKTGGQVIPISRKEARGPAVKLRQEPVSIQLELEDPGGIRERAFPGFRQHQRSRLGIDFPLGRSQSGQFGSNAVGRRPAGLQVLYGKPRENRFFRWKGP